MKQKALIITTIVFLALSIAFATGYDSVYIAGPDEQRFDYIYFSVEIGVLLTFLYLIAAKLSLRRRLPLLLVFAGPFLVFLVSFALTIMACRFKSDTRDQVVLQLFLLIQSILAVVLVLPFAIKARRKTARV